MPDKWSSLYFPVEIEIIILVVKVEEKHVNFNRNTVLLFGKKHP